MGIYSTAPSRFDKVIYSTKHPGFGKATALATCPAQSGCCLEPFESVSNVGCIYANASFLPPKPYATARAMCQSLWPTADLLVPYAFGNLDDYLSARGVVGPWLGATKNTATSQWKWVDGSSVSTSSWGSKVLLGLLTSQPDGQGEPIDGYPTNCGHFLSAVGLLGVQRMGDDACEHLRPAVCQMK
ncbi:uncharacterized protein LOC108670540 [Hyalella azteca]|uniref:Uncharacterized protein LOC108670540 n=1 Tax=Hyalella azteca TaxID=294128 RepID=A0A8B7NIN1_HYAAZ|nr:uncharacterized protein LOC108670540 [Hyalella azteca]